VRVAAGTDAGNIGTLHGPALHRELELLVAAGFTPMQVIVAATRDAAYAFSPAPDIGVLRRGARADLLVLSADPLADIGNLARIERVYARGVEHDPRLLVPPSPEAIVQRQIEARNAHELDGLLATHADAAEIFGPSIPTISGIAALRDFYRDLFESSPQINCQVIDRIVEGSYVIAQELCFVTADRPRVRTIVVYLIENGRIGRMSIFPGE
jgi:hypothetical protein